MKKVNTAQLLKSVALSDVGSVRTENQDSYCLLERPEYCFYALADGIGGLPAGSTASRLAISAVKEYIESKRTVSEPVLCEAIKRANQEVYNSGQQNPACKGMGTTFVALAFVGLDLFIANVGDSRAYRLRDGQLSRLTEDHTFRTMLERSGVVSQEKAERNPLSDLLTRSIGPTADVEVDCWLSSDQPAPDDIYLLCTDGLYGLLKEYEIANILQEFAVEDIAPELIALAKQRGAPDNVSVIAIKTNDQLPLASSFIDGPSFSKEKYRRNRNKVVRRTVRAWMLISFVSGLATGIGAAYLGNSFGMPSENLSAELDTTYYPFSGTQIADIELDSSLDLAALVKQGDDAALNKLEMENKVLSRAIEVTTRKLSLWQRRREQFFSGDNLEALADEVSISDKAVLDILDLTREHRKAYLLAAEELVYNPRTDAQEQLVSSLNSRYQQSVEKLRKSLQRSIDTSIARELVRLRHLTARRDKVEGAIEKLNRQIGS